MLRTQELNS